VIDPAVHQSPAYAAAKTGVLSLTRFAARELGPHGITVNCMVPSLALSGPVLEAYWQSTPEDRKRQYLKSIALERLPRLEELAAVVLFLASDESSYVTGVALDVNGGSFMA
jgi:3-oxoacyl-[acyl-carrier protein] reductase